MLGLMISVPCILLLDGRFVCMCDMSSCRRGTVSGLLGEIHHHSLGTLVEIEVGVVLRWGGSYGWSG